ncbi:MAG: hydroxymethylbilane synthase [Alphaproteobacteria bacterium]|nr:hydroxymethylbilane synthase [Alphaproteobacteria bacterium]
MQNTCPVSKPVHFTLKIGTRASPMARAMADGVRDLIVRLGAPIDAKVLPFTSEGDRIKGDLKIQGGKGTFIKDLERRLLAGEIDCAIHSLKDIPGDLPPHEDLALIAFLPREDPRDALILRDGVREDDLRDNPKALIGTSAPRRSAMLKQLYPGIRTDLCRGNVNSRLRKLDDGEYDAIVLSYAGLKRLNMDGRVSRVYDTAEILPAIGQGILAIQVRRADIERCPFLRDISDRTAETVAAAERAMLFRLQGNCHSAIAGHCEILPGGALHLRGAVFDPASARFVEAQHQAHGPDGAEALGHHVADALLAQGAAAFI